MWHVDDVNFSELMTGADVNNTTAVLGSTLHVACADNIANQADIVRTLLGTGADPNIVAKSDEGLAFPCVLSEYITSNGHKDSLNREVIQLLLRYGAQVSPLEKKTESKHFFSNIDLFIF